MRKDGALMGTVVVAGSAAVNAAHTFSHAGQHVMSLPAWQLAAVLLLPLQGMGCLAGLWAARVLSRPVSDGRARPVGSPAGQRRTPGRSHR